MLDRLFLILGEMDRLLFAPMLCVGVHMYILQTHSNFCIKLEYASPRETWGRAETIYVVFGTSGRTFSAPLQNHNCP